MKRIPVLILFLIPLTTLQAQRDYLPTPEDLTRFKNSKTHVVLNDNPLSEYNFEIEDAVKKFWTITGYEIIPHDDFEEKSADENASFLYVATVTFLKDKTHTRYLFLCLSMGGERNTTDDLKDITTIPLGYYGVDEDHYTYKLGTLLRFMQLHVQRLIDDPALVSQNVFQHYNENMGYLNDKVLYLVEDEIAQDIASEAKIRDLYPYAFKIVDRETIQELIMEEDERAVFLHKVGPEGRIKNARIYKMIVGAADDKLYYYNYHKLSDKKPDALLRNDIRRMGQAPQK